MLLALTGLFSQYFCHPHSKSKYAVYPSGNLKYKWSCKYSQANGKLLVTCSVHSAHIFLNEVQDKYSWIQCCWAKFCSAKALLWLESRHAKTSIIQCLMKKKTYFNCKVQCNLVVKRNERN